MCKKEQTFVFFKAIIWRIIEKNACSKPSFERGGGITVMATFHWENNQYAYSMYF